MTAARVTSVAADTSQGLGGWKPGLGEPGMVAACDSRTARIQH